VYDQYTYPDEIAPADPPVPETETPEIYPTEASTLEPDLPALPADLKSQQTAQPQDITAGSIIAFKQLDLSEATNWQPVISDYRTAYVESKSDTQELQLRLANRDVPQKFVKYDNKGDVIHSRFEMPGDEEEDDGYRTLNIADLIEPKVVQAAITMTESGEGLAETARDSSGDTSLVTAPEYQENFKDGCTVVLDKTVLLPIEEINVKA